MKILLINPPLENMIKNAPTAIIKGRDIGYPNLGLMYIASFLEKNSDNEVKIIDMQIEGLDYNGLEKKLVDEKPDIVGVPATSFTLLDALITCGITKKIDKEVITILGGRHGSIYPKETANLENVDFVVVGEGEYTCLELIEKIEKNKDLDKIKGIAFRKNDKTIFTGHRGWIKDLDKLPFPARHLTPYKKYKYALAKNKIFTTMMTSRGCPYNCSFCDRSQGNIFRARSPKNVVDEIEDCVNLEIKEIFIHDDTFTINKKRVIDICNDIIERKLDVDLTVRTRVNLVDEDIIKKLKRAGCERIQYGIESGNQKILNILRKGITLDQIRRAVKLAKKYDLDTLGDFMIGSPEETKKEILDTVNFAIELDLDYVLFNATTPYPRTDLYRMGIEIGLFNDFWLDFAKNPRKEFKLSFWNEKLSNEDLDHMIKYAYKRFYKRPFYILKRTIKITSISELIEKIRIGLGIFGMRG